MGQLYWGILDHELSRCLRASHEPTAALDPILAAIAHHSDVKDHHTVLRLAERAQPKVGLLSDKEQANFFVFCGLAGTRPRAIRGGD